MKKILILILLAVGMLALEYSQSDETVYTICCVGDSLMRPMPAHLREIFQTSEVKFRIRDWSQGGLSSVTYQEFYARHAEQWMKTRPDFILIQLGTNDALPLLQKSYSPEDFEVNMKTIINRFREFAGGHSPRPQIFLATVPLFHEGDLAKEKNRVIKKTINPSIRRIAKEKKLTLVDNYSVLKNKPKLYDSDGIHPNHQGENAIANNWARAIRLTFRSRRLFS